ncbi:MAG: DUF4192 domain-containing protein [Propionibacteriaceae bacterium]
MLRAGSCADLLAVVPYLLGFHPQESLVLLALRRQRVELVARVDLPGTGGDPTGENPVADTASHLDDVRILRQVADAARSVAPEGVVLIGYSTVVGRAESALDAAVEEVADLPLIEVLRADGHRWWSRRCDEACCPAEGTPYVVETSRLAAEAVVAGLSALPDRGELAALVAGPPPTEVAGLASDAESIRIELARLSRPARQQEMHRLVLGAVAAIGVPGSPTWPAVPDRDLSLRLAALATDVHVRDVAWSLVDQPSFATHVALWQAVVAHAPDRLALAPLCLVGIAAWVGGHGALMVCALTRALEIDADYGMAQLLSDLNTAAVRPSLWEEVVGPLRAELGLEPPAVPSGR